MISVYYIEHCHHQINTSFEKINIPVRIKLLWIFPVEWTVLKQADWNDNDSSFRNSDSINDSFPLAVAISPAIGMKFAD